MVLLFCTAVAVPLSGQYSIDKSVFGNGGSEMQNSSFKLNGTSGQSVAGINKNSIYLNNIGFWYQTKALATAVEPEINEITGQCELYQNYPNPFYQTTTISYSIPDEGSANYLYVKLVVFNILGKEVMVLINEQQPPGTYKVKWNRSTNSPGMYFYKLKVFSSRDKAVKCIKTKKMTVLKR